MIRIKHGEEWLYVTDIDINPAEGKAILNVNSNHWVEVDIPEECKVVIDGDLIWPKSEPTKKSKTK